MGFGSVACAFLAWAIAPSRSALAAFLQLDSSLPFWSSHFSFATSYCALAFASATWKRFFGVSLSFRSASAFATFFWPSASALQMSFAFPFRSLHLSIAALCWSLIALLSAAWTFIPSTRAKAAAASVIFDFMGIPFFFQRHHGA